MCVHCLRFVSEFRIPLKKEEKKEVCDSFTQMQKPYVSLTLPALQKGL